jgi:hypothetical protein
MIEDDFKIKNKYGLAISRILYLSILTISMRPQSCETIPLKLHMFKSSV